MIGGPRLVGWVHAPVTEFFSILVLISSFVAKFSHSGDYSCDLRLFRFEPSYLLTLFFSTFAISNFFKLLIAITALYHFRVVERIMGSQKTAFLMLFSKFIYICFSFCLMYFFHIDEKDIKGNLTYEYSFLVLHGPAWCISALFVLYICYVPLFRVPVLPVSDRFIAWFLFTVYIGIDIFGSGVGTCAGIIAAIIYSQNLGNIMEFRFPPVIVSFFDDFIKPVFHAPSRNVQVYGGGMQFFGNLNPEQNRAFRVAMGDAYAASDVLPGEQQQQQQQQQQQYNGNGDFEQLPTVEPDPEAVATLVAMGVDERVARSVLRDCDNNVSVAANRIFDSSQ